MKFWELTSAFREEPDILAKVLGQDKWRKYIEYYERLDEIIRDQQREILDGELPFELCYEVAEKSKKEFWLAYEKQPQVLYSYKASIESLERLLASEVLVRFGGNKIEEALECSYTNVYSKQLNGGAEVITSFNLTSVGLLSVIRTEESKILDNSILSTADKELSWVVLNEAKMVVDPYEAYKKLYAQNRQNIRHYILKGVNHCEKPELGKVLHIIT